MVRPDPPKVIAITGATGGIGLELVARYARPGRHFLLAGRDPARLELVSQQAITAGATVEILTISLADPEIFGAALTAFDARMPVDLLIVGAGVKTGNVAGIDRPKCNAS